MDAVIMSIAVASCGGVGPQSADSGVEAADGTIVVKGPNPTRAFFVVMTPKVRGVTASLTVFDVSGRRVALVRTPSGSQLTWRGQDESGAIVADGIYLYRIDLGKHRQEGKVVVIR
jgi:surface antigen